MAFRAGNGCGPCVFRQVSIDPRLATPTTRESHVSHPAADPPRLATTRILACLALAMLLSSLGTSSANVALPTLVRAFGASFQAVQWVVLAYLLALTTLVVSVGRLGDLLGRRRLLLAGIALFTVASAACGAAPSLGVLVAARAVQGLGAAVMMALAIALVGDAVPPQRAGSAMGLLGTTSAIGTALGPSLGGILIGGFGWPAVFLCNVPLGLAALLLARALPPDRGPAGTPTLDIGGSAVLMLALAAYCLSMTLGHGHFGARNVALLAIAGAGAALFLVLQGRRRFPLVALALFRQPCVGSGFATSFVATTVAMTTLVVGPFYLAGALQLGPAAIGLVMTAGPLVAALAGVPAGRGVDRFGARGMGIAGLAAMAVGAAALAAVAPARGIPGYLLPLVTLTGGFAVFQAANNTAVMTAVEASQRGVVAGLLTLSRNLGLVTGASAMGAVFAAAGAAGGRPHAQAATVVAGAHAAFACAALLVMAALLLALAAGRQEQPAAAPAGP
jgi:EmrB/QacA subfamily drug resistance transporter